MKKANPQRLHTVHLYSTYIIFLKGEHDRKGEQMGGCQALGWGGREVGQREGGVIMKGQQKGFCGDGTVWSIHEPTQHHFL